MHLRAVIPTILLTTTGLCAQDKPAEVPRLPPVVEQQAAIIPVKTLSGDSFNRLARMLSVFKVEYSADEKLRTILVYARPEVIAQIRESRRGTRPPGSEAAIGRNIEMTLTFLRCNASPQTASGELPADMEAVAKQIRAATQCKSIELWDTLPLRLQEGKVTEQNLRLPGSLPEIPGAVTKGQLRIVPEAVTRKESGRLREIRDDENTITGAVYDIEKYTQLYGLVQLSGRIAQHRRRFQRRAETVLGKLSGAEDTGSTFVVVALKVLD